MIAGAGSGNRTRLSTLGRSHSTDELYPQITGADEGTRTHDLCFTKALLYQLSYIGELNQVRLA
jgi:hypothetical protein